MRVRRIVLLTLLFGGLLCLGIPSGMQAAGAVSISVFHEQLTPYGRWVVAGSIGSVWVPRVSAGWAPYVDGEWVYTDYGWTWISYDPWGDVPCHYGAWAWADPYGWVWAPGTVWAPAWVTWAFTDDFIGWAPIPPTFALTVTGYAGAPVVVAQTRYVFVPTRSFVGARISTVRLPAERNATIFPRAVKATAYKVSDGIVRTQGLPRSRVEKVTAKKIEPVPIARTQTRPTTLAAAGASKSTVRVALPAAERAHLAESGPPAKAEAKSEERTKASKSSHPPAKPEEPARASRSASESKAKAPPETRVAAKPASPSSKTGPEVKGSKEHSKPETRAASGPEQRKPATHSRPEPPAERAPEKNAARPPDESHAAPPPHVKAPTDNRGHEETRVASHAARPAPPPKAHPPREAQKEKAPEKESKPPGEQRN